MVFVDPLLGEVVGIKETNRFSITLIIELPNGFSKAQTIEIDAKQLFIDDTIQLDYYDKCIKLLAGLFINLSNSWRRTKREV